MRPLTDTYPLFGRIRWPNVTLAFVYFVSVFSCDEYASAVIGSDCSVQSQEIGWEEYRQIDLFCVEWGEKPFRTTQFDRIVPHWVSRCTCKPSQCDFLDFEPKQYMVFRASLQCRLRQCGLNILLTGLLRVNCQYFAQTASVARWRYELTTAGWFLVLELTNCMWHRANVNQRTSLRIFIRIVVVFRPKIAAFFSLELY